MSINSKHILAAIVSGLFMIQPAFADKPDGAGGGKGNGNGQGNKQQQQAQGQSRQNAKPQKQQGADRDKGSGKHEASGKKHHDVRHDNDKGRSKGDRDRDHHDRRGDRENVSVNIHFNTQQQSYLREYYGREFRSGHCPPGLAKKNNGCMPPGQAKKWRVGRPLDRHVIYYELPPTVITHIGMPPRGYRYVRVASDILMIAIGTGMVIDAIADLSSL